MIDAHDYSSACILLYSRIISKIEPPQNIKYRQSERINSSKTFMLRGIVVYTGIHDTKESARQKGGSTVEKNKIYLGRHSASLNVLRCTVPPRVCFIFDIIARLQSRGKKQQRWFPEHGVNEYLEIQFAPFRRENELSCSPRLDYWSPEESSRLEYLLIYEQA